MEAIALQIGSHLADSPELSSLQAQLRASIAEMIRVLDKPPVEDIATAWCSFMMSLPIFSFD